MRRNGGEVRTSKASVVKPAPLPVQIELPDIAERCKMDFDRPPDWLAPLFQPDPW